MSQFIDEAKLYAKAGDGGDGIVAWRREKFVPRGGPAGGDGGNGGDVILVADENVRSLLDFKYVPHLKAKDGERGRSKNQFGAAGEDAIAKVPVGTEVYDLDSGELLGDLKEQGQELVVCEGGSGGHGNSRFATSSRQAPDFAKPGLPGEERNLKLSLKLLADVGLLGFPNAGKSTFLSRISAAKPKIADYPFTTLVPNLGVVRADDGKSFVVADIPGLIEGAADGAGLGVRFLKHLERVAALCHLVEPPLFAEEGEDADDDQVLKKRYQALRHELVKFNQDLVRLPEIVIVTKSDLSDGDPLDDPKIRVLKEELDAVKKPLLFMSAVTGEGIDDVIRALWKLVRKAEPERQEKKAFDPLAKEKLR